MKTKFQILYMKPDWFRHGIIGGQPDPKDMTKTHVHLKDIELDGGSAQLERIFHEMQAEVWSPDGQAASLIRSKGLAHTSMSIGDVIVVDGDFFLVANSGFLQFQDGSWVR